MSVTVTEEGLGGAFEEGFFFFGKGREGKWERWKNRLELVSR